MMYYGNGIGGWAMVLMTVSSLLFWALVIAGIVAMVRYTGRDARRAGPVTYGPTPQQMLAERFARGDIDEEEYTRRRHVLDTTAPPRGPSG
ncbi:SHOCT domain-containing protein [Actinoplanes sp. NPDC024001]|uniref:SHOCT domain-containing protein n=1 Tax=Actinoplanes sp. NPDC024001 TaxID=3154598 RepID=UPI0033DB9FF8